MFIGTALFNEIVHIKTLKIITRTMDSGIPNIEIFFNKKICFRTVCIKEFLRNIHMNIQILLIL